MINSHSLGSGGDTSSTVPVAKILLTHLLFSQFARHVQAARPPFDAGTIVNDTLDRCSPWIGDSPSVEIPWYAPHTFVSFRFVTLTLISFGVAVAFVGGASI